MKRLTLISFLLISLLILSLSISSLAQGNGEVFTVKGFVKDNYTNEKLPGVNIFLKGTSRGTVTGADGNYLLKVTAGRYKIVYSFVGYEVQEKELNINSDKVIMVALEPDKKILDEIEITAQRKFFGNMEYGRDLPTIDARDIIKQNSTNASDLLHARLSGVWTTKTSGAPGDQTKIRIRGQTSFFSSAEPLFVIDGVPVPIVNLASLGIADLNVYDIENITVLKDASSTALYGYQGGNGVILIDTRRTSNNFINFSVKTGMNWFDNFYDLMNTKEFLNSVQLASDKIGSKMELYNPPYNDTLCDHNRQKEIFNTAFFQEYQLSTGFQKKSFKCYLSGNYTKQEGILPGSLYQRATLAANLNKHFGTKLAIGISYRGSYQYNQNNQNEYNGNRLLFEGITKSPCLEDTPDSMINNPKPPYQSYIRIHNKYEILNDSELLQSIIDNNNNALPIISNAISFSGRYQLTKHLNMDIIESYMYRWTNYQSKSQYYAINIGKPKVELSSVEKVKLMNHQINISYNNSFGANDISLLFANRIYADNLSWEVDSMNNKLPEHYYLRNSMACYGKKGSVIRRINSYIVHASYNYQRTYFASVVANLSRLREGSFIDYYTLFPSLSLSWNILKEPFFNFQKRSGELHFYFNYGTSGNYPLNGLSNDLYNVEYWNTNSGNYVNLHIIDQLANHHLKHESTSEFDVGIKSSFFKERLKLNAAIFNKSISNQIIKRDIPRYYGGGKIYVNMGDIDVEGYEFSVEAIPIKTKDVDWYLNGSFSTSNQTISKLIDNQDMLFRNEDILFPEFIIKEGAQLGDIFGYQCLGKWEEKYEGKKLYYNLGNMAFLNKDTTNMNIDENDKVVIGNSVPDFTWNLSSSLRYKNLSLDFIIYSVWGVEKYNATRAGTIMTGVNREIIEFYKENIKAIQNKRFYESSLFIDDASFIRLKSVTLNYEPDKAYKGVRFSFSLSLENVVTITKYNGYDPEATTFTDNNFSDNAIDRGAYPSPKGVIATINLKY
ncbi:MAG: SusC/RagA family TonB-linked outer membrane protein [Prolixibacteraceae bacterium]|nr:SusC/RagA family TonB-linked outer membrane protein [Prolixibacteraceae bacterium]